MAAPPCSVLLPRPALHCSLSSSPSSSRSDLPRSLRSRTSSPSFHAATISKRTPFRHPVSLQQSVRRRARPSASPRAVQEPLHTVAVEDDDVSLEGVARVDREQPINTSSWGRIGLLACGDVLAILIFAAVGRLTHGLSALDWDVVETADPFIAGWLLGAYFLGGFSPEGQGTEGLPSAVFATAKSWAVGIPLGLAIRAIGAGHVPPQPFVLVSLASTFILLIGWRSAFVATYPTHSSDTNRLRGDRQGSVFELFQLLTSLVRRW